ncbi:MAG: DEAD/DEAH box helicase, partial [Crocinitomicaceae bacterium]
MKFNELNLLEPILNALTKQGYTEPTPIQQQAIPYVLEGRDVMGCAQTGTGKTAAFAIPIIQRIHASKQVDNSNKIRALIVTPTRELAIQIEESFKNYGSELKLRYTVIFGGVNQTQQVNRLKNGVDVLIATPGRLLDLQQQGFIKLGNLEIFVLDEADRMLDMGFIHDVKKIIKLIPAKRQTLFFSATMPKEIT